VSLEISVVVSTLDRKAYLAKALKGLAGQTLEDDRFEVVVVDNGSSDGTLEQAERFRGELPGLHVVVEPVTGLSRARDRGWRQAAGEIVAFLDDDAIPEPGWLQAIVNGFKADGRIGVLGGRAVAIWEADRPAWLDDRLLTALTVIDWGDPAREVGSGMFLAGANIAFTRKLLERYGGFSTGLGRVGGKLLSNEETSLVKAMQADGYLAWWEPAAVVRHHVPAERLTRSWFRRRYYWQGISNAFMEIENGQAHHRLRSGMGELFRTVAAPGVVLDLVRSTDDPETWFQACMQARQFGHAWATLGLVRRP